MYEQTGFVPVHPHHQVQEGEVAWGRDHVPLREAIRQATSHTGMEAPVFKVRGEGHNNARTTVDFLRFICRG